jgi:NAD+ kinase
MARIRGVAILAKRKNAEAKAAAEEIAGMLARRGIRALAVSPLRIKGCTIVGPGAVDGRADAIFAIGGDGTTLKAFRTVSGDLPLLSINVGGHRGILAEVDTDTMETAVGDMLAGKCFIDARLRIQASCGRRRFPPALNEILFTRANLTHTPTITIKLMGDEISHRMDGIVISTPTGSTGHSLSIGGPVLHEGMSCLILSPVAPVSRLPQLVIPVEEVTVKSDNKAHLIVDGQESFPIGAGEQVRISRHPHDARFLRLHKKGMRQLAKLGF